MKQLEATPQYLAACTEALLEALGDARELVVKGAIGAPLRSKLMFADSLLTVIRNAVGESPYDRPASQALSYLSGQVQALQASVRPVELSF